MNPSAARASIVAISVLVLSLSAVVTTVVYEVLSPLESLPRALLSLLSWVVTYYACANLIFWKAVLRLSSSSSSTPREATTSSQLT